MSPTVSRKASSPAALGFAGSGPLHGHLGARRRRVDLGGEGGHRPGEPVERRLLRLPRPLGQRRLGLERRDERRLACLERADPARERPRVGPPALPSATLPSFSRHGVGHDLGAEPRRGDGEAGTDHRLDSPPATSSASRVASAWARSSRSGASASGPASPTVRPDLGRGRGCGSAGHEVGGVHPDRVGAERALQRRLERRRPRLAAEGVAGAAEVAGRDPEGIVEGLDAPDRPGDEAAEGAERLGLAAEPAGIADHLVADEPGRDQVGERRRGGIGGWDIQDEPLDALGDAGVGVLGNIAGPSVRRRG